MKQTLTTSQISDALLRDEYARWSYEAARALAEYYENLENESGEEIELDVVAIRCDWNQYETARDIANAYDIKDLDGLSDEEVEKAVENVINDNSEFIKLPKGKGYLVRVF